MLGDYVGNDYFKNKDRTNFFQNVLILPLKKFHSLENFRMTFSGRIHKFMQVQLGPLNRVSARFKIG